MEFKAVQGFDLNQPSHDLQGFKMSTMIKSLNWVLTVHQSQTHPLNGLSNCETCARDKNDPLNGISNVQKKGRLYKRPF